VSSHDVDPGDLGLARAVSGDLQGGDAATNAELARRVLAGQAGPHRDIVVLNAGAALVAAGRAGDLAAGVAAAGASLDEGRAEAAMAKLVSASRSAAESD
jgi:anthranilate phosphoribosyltransferase